MLLNVNLFTGLHGSVVSISFFQSSRTSEWTHKHSFLDLTGAAVHGQPGLSL